MYSSWSLRGKKHNPVFLPFKYFFPFALKYRSQCWTSRGVFFIVNQYWSIGCLGVEYGSISHQAVEEIWFQLAREAHSRFPSSGNSRHGNISQMDWYRLARTFLATEPAQGNFCHISLTQLGQAVKKKKRGSRVPQWPSIKSNGQTLNKYSIISMNVVFFFNKETPTNQLKHWNRHWSSTLCTHTPQCGHVLWNFWYWLCGGQLEMHTVSCY